MTQVRVEYNMPADDYHKVSACSASFLKAMRRSPAHAMAASSKPSTSAMEFGTAVHCLLLDGAEKFEKSYGVLPDVDLRTKAGKEAKAAAQASRPGCLWLTQDEMDRCKAIKTAVESKVSTSHMFGMGHPEVSLFWQRGEVVCKARLDFLSEMDRAIIDVKTTQDASQRAWERSMSQYGYAHQAAWYLDAAKRCGLKHDRFYFVAVETEAPHGVAVYECEPDYIDAARKENERMFKTYCECMANNNWPAYPDEVQTLLCPPWMGNGWEA